MRNEDRCRYVIAEPCDGGAFREHGPFGASLEPHLVLEFAGDTFAMDLGICDYGDPLSIPYKQCQRHNMLVPTGTTERPHPTNPDCALPTRDKSRCIAPALRCRPRSCRCLST